MRLDERIKDPKNHNGEQMLKSKIEELKKQIIEEANLVQNMIDFAMCGLVEKDSAKLEEVKLMEQKLNKTEMEIEERCIQLIALHQPEARNLRTLVMILKMNNDLERIGDLAINIVESAEYLITKPFIAKLINLPSMAKEAGKMLQDALTAFINEDTKLAHQVCLYDDIVDDLKEQVYRVLITYMMDNPATIKRAFQLNNVATNLERIADLSTNIAEETIFMVEGRVAKHYDGEEK